MSTIENFIEGLQTDFRAFQVDFSAVFRHLVLGANQGILDLLGIEPELSESEKAEKERLRLAEIYQVPGPKMPEECKPPPSLLPAGVEEPPIKTSGRYDPGAVETRVSPLDQSVFVKTRTYGYTFE